MAEGDPLDWQQLSGSGGPFSRMPSGYSVDEKPFVSPYAGMAEYLLDRSVSDRGKRTDDRLAAFRDREIDDALASITADYGGLEDEYNSLVQQFEDAKQASIQGREGADEEIKRIADEIARVESLIEPAIDPDLLRDDLREEILAGLPEPTDIDPDLLKEELRQDLIAAMPDQEALVADVIAGLPDDSSQLQTMIDQLRSELTGQFESMIPDAPDLDALRQQILSEIPEGPDMDAFRAQIMGDVMSQQPNMDAFRAQIMADIPQGPDISPLEGQIADIMSRLTQIEGDQQQTDINVQPPQSDSQTTLPGSGGGYGGEGQDAGGYSGVDLGSVGMGDVTGGMAPDAGTFPVSAPNNESTYQAPQQPVSRTQTQPVRRTQTQPVRRTQTQPVRSSPGYYGVNI